MAKFSEIFVVMEVHSFEFAAWQVNTSIIYSFTNK